MKKWNLIVDVERCENCNNCVLSSKDEYVGNKHANYSAPVSDESSELIKISRNVRGQAPVIDTAYLVEMCNHCDNPPCKVVGGDAVIKRKDGIVIIDPDKAVGRKDIVKACPYGAIEWNEDLHLPQIWIFDAHLLDQGWKQPRCAQSCPTGVFEAIKVKDDEMIGRVKAEGLEVIKPHLGTKPRVYYRNMYRYSKCFIGGTVVSIKDTVEDCVPGALVTLHKGSEKIATVNTDAFGEFKIDHLTNDGSEYKVSIKHKNYGSSFQKIILSESCYLGVIELR